MWVSNLNKYMIDRPVFEQLTFAPAVWIAWTNICDDWVRFIYTLFQTSATASQFWRYDTRNDMWQQLATPPTQTWTIANMTFVDNMWGQYNWATYWALYLFVWNATICYLYKYDVATNTWSAALSTTNVPATFWTDAYLISLSPNKNNYDATYHNWVTRTITASAWVSVWATSISVSALPESLAIWTRLKFWTFDITIWDNATKWATSLTVWALAQWLASWCILNLPNWEDVCLTATATAWATSLSVYPIQKYITNWTVIKVDLYVVLTALAAAAATSITVSAVNYSISNWSVAYYYWNMYLVWNNATQMYRYNIWWNAWTTTSANSWNPALVAMPGTIWTWCGIKWVPWIAKDKLFIVRWNATATVYVYNLVTNTVTTLSYNPATETFTTWSSVAVRQLWWKAVSFLIQKDSTWRVYELDLWKSRCQPKMTQWLYPIWTTVVWDKSCCITSIDWIEFYYSLINSSTWFVRCALIDS